MKVISQIKKELQSVHPLLWVLLVCALGLRLTGITYGLPLMVVGDEPPFVLAALRMLELKTIIPSLNPEAFATILYYPPYISYLYLPFFAIAAGVQLLVWQGDSALFAEYLLSDLSIFFILARVIMIVIGVVSIFFVYKIADAIYRSKPAALIAALLLATSLLHISLSMVGRHWIPVSFLFVLVLYVLTRESLSVRKKLLISLLVAGVGAGISTVSFLLLIPIGLWFLLFSQTTIRKIVRDKLLWGGSVAFIALSILPSILFSNSQGALVGGFSLLQDKNPIDLILSPVWALSLNLYSEPILVGLFVLGLVVLWFKNRTWFLFSIGFFVLYIAAFYLLFLFSARFMLPLVILYALVAPAAYLALKELLPKVALVVFGLLLLVPFVVSVQFSFLALQNDTRVLAREWVLANVETGEKVVVYGNLMRISTHAAAVEALRAIEPGALRRVEGAEEKLNNTTLPFVLNASFVENRETLSSLADHIANEGYRYVVIDEAYAQRLGGANPFAQLSTTAEEVARFEGFGETTSIAESAYLEPLYILFSGKRFGPTVVIYRI